MSVPVEISAPESCTGVPAMHPIEFNLKRRIIVQAMDASGNGVTGVRVTIAGAHVIPSASPLTLRPMRILPNTLNSAPEKGP